MPMKTKSFSKESKTIFSLDISLYAKARTLKALSDIILEFSKTLALYSFEKSNNFPFIDILLQIESIESKAPLVNTRAFLSSTKFTVVINFLSESKGISSILLNSFSSFSFIILSLKGDSKSAISVGSPVWLFSEYVASLQRTIQATKSLDSLSFKLNSLSFI